jgi:predicted CoA-binding protein
MPNNLEAALNPKSVAIVGASDNPHKVGGRPILFMKKYGYKGRIFPINPTRAEVQGYTAYPDLASLPGVPVFGSDNQALRALKQLAAHAEMMRLGMDPARAKPGVTILTADGEERANDTGKPKP